MRLRPLCVRLLTSPHASNQRACMHLLPARMCHHTHKNPFPPALRLLQRMQAASTSRARFTCAAAHAAAGCRRRVTRALVRLCVLLPQCCMRAQHNATSVRCCAAWFIPNYFLFVGGGGEEGGRGARADKGGGGGGDMKWGGAGGSSLQNLHAMVEGVSHDDAPVAVDGDAATREVELSVAFA